MNKQERLIWYNKEFDEISEEIKSKESLSYLDFLRIRNFKLQNSSRESGKNMQEVTKEAFKLAENDEIEKAISKLLEIHGVAIPIASTILAMKYPNKFCIIDRIVISKLRKDEWLKKYVYDTETYKKYLFLMRGLSKKKNVNLRDFERNLFEGNHI